MHLFVYLVFIISWMFFGTVLYHVNDDDNETNKYLWILTLTAFLMGILSEAILISSILYAIYWLFETGEIIKRDRKRISDGVNRDIEI